ncbi:MAG TPA: TetR family transcriptional regulator [Gaiellaceae bacterium]
MVGLRESKKQRTREHIAAEAMRLFAQRGFDHVTVAEIAHAAAVSEKTVFNYFPTKEDVFFDEVPARLAALVAAIRDRPRGVSVFTALRDLQTRDADRLTSPYFATFARILEESPALLAKELDVMRRYADTLAEALRADLHVPELDARVAANAVVSVHWQFFRNARRAALAGKHGPAAARRLRSDLKRAYRLLEGGLAAIESS